jgi:hypothetical protein
MLCLVHNQKEMWPFEAAARNSFRKQACLTGILMQADMNAVACRKCHILHLQGTRGKLLTKRKHDVEDFIVLVAGHSVSDC